MLDVRQSDEFWNTIYTNSGFILQGGKGIKGNWLMCLNNVAITMLTERKDQIAEGQKEPKTLKIRDLINTKGQNPIFYDF